MSEFPSFINGALILGSDLIVSNGLQPVAIRPLGPPHQAYTIEIMFEEGIEANQALFNTTTIGGNIKITVSNCRGKPFIGTPSPLYVANYNNQKILMNLLITVIGTDFNSVTKVLTYTVFYGGPVNAATT